MLGAGQKTGRGLPYLFAVGMGLILGCHHTVTDPNRPPPHPEEFKLPPSEDSRFSKPVQYPKNLLNNDILQSRMAKKDNQKGPGMMKGPSGMPGS